MGEMADYYNERDEATLEDMGINPYGSADIQVAECLNPEHPVNCNGASLDCNPPQQLNRRKD